VIVLDTNVISEAMRGPRADPLVLTWLRSLSAPPVTTVINRAEILAGVALLAPGDRRDRLMSAALAALSGLTVCLPLTPECADHSAEIVAGRRRTGRPVGSMDALVAAIVRESGGRLATRDTNDFAGLGLDLVNPWRTDPPLS
jgi:predicted nucleic acid-binding protein